MGNNQEQLVGWPAFSDIIARLDWRPPENRGPTALPMSTASADDQPLPVRAAKFVSVGCETRVASLTRYIPAPPR